MESEMSLRDVLIDKCCLLQRTRSWFCPLPPKKRYNPNKCIPIDINDRIYTIIIEIIDGLCQRGRCLVQWNSIERETDYLEPGESQEEAEEEIVRLDAPKLYSYERTDANGRIVIAAYDPLGNPPLVMDAKLVDTGFTMFLQYWKEQEDYYIQLSIWKTQDHMPFNKYCNMYVIDVTRSTLSYSEKEGLDPIQSVCDRVMWDKKKPTSASNPCRFVC